MFLSVRELRHCLLLVLAVLAIGCRSSRRVHDPEYAELLQDVSYAYHDPAPAEAAMSYAAPGLAGPNPVEVYISHALTQNPDIQTVRKRLEAKAFQVPQAASLQDPMMGITAFPESVQTAAGQQELLMSVSQKFPWYGKLRARSDVAELDAQVVRAQLSAVELTVIEEVKQAYYELYFVQRAIQITEADRKLLNDLTRIAESKYRTGAVSQQDVLRAQLEVSNLDNQLIRLRQELASAQAKLARRLHLSPDSDLLAMDELPIEGIPQDLDMLYRQAIAARPELHAQLAAVDRDRRAVDLAQLDYFPDVTLGMTWINTSTAGISPVANGRDPFLVGVTFNMPIYHKRIEAGVRQAEAQAVADRRQYDSLKDRTLEQVKDLFVKARSQQELLDLFRTDIIPKADQTLQVSARAYQAGDVDFLQLIDNWRQLLRFQLAYQRLEAQLRQTLASLERVVGGFAAYEAVTGMPSGLPGFGDPAPPEPLPPIPQP
jgi:outer membrane protein TolC